MEKKPKIVFVSHESKLYGAPKSLLILLEKVKEKFDICVVTGGEGDFVDAVKQLEIPITVLKPNNRLYHTFINFINLYRLIFQKNPALVYVNTVVNFYPVLAAKFAFCPVIVHVREGSDYLFPESSKDKRTINLICRFSDRFICVSHAIADLLQQKLKRKTPIDVVYNGIDCSKFQFSYQIRENTRKQMNIKDEQLLIGFIGSLSQRKGVDIFLKAAENISAEFSQVHFLVVGGRSTQSKKIQKNIENLNLADRFTIMPFTKDVVNIYSAIDIFSMTSLIEPFSRVNLEASSMGRAIVATAIDGNREIFQDRKNALLIPPNSVTDLENAWRELIQNPQLREELGKKALSVVQTQFTQESYTRKIINIIENTIFI